MMVNIPSVGIVDGREQIEATYTGPTTSTIKKIGRGLPGQSNVIYAYSATPENTYGPTFNFFAIDAHLFVNGPFTYRRLSIPEAAVQPEVQQIEMQTQRVFVAPVEQPAEPKPNGTDVRIMGLIDKEDDFTKLKGIGLEKDKKLKSAGVSTFAELMERPSDEISLILGSTESTVVKLKEEASYVVV